MMSKIAAAILAGGKAERFDGKPKGLLELSTGGTILKRLLSEIEKAGIEKCVICSNHKIPYKRFNKKILPDISPGKGPLAGIESALEYFKDEFEAVLFMPCDLPCISAREIRRLKEQFFNEDAKVLVSETPDYLWHPLCAVVHKDILPIIKSTINENKLRVKPIWRIAGMAVLHFESSRPFTNINCPEDYNLLITNY